MSTIIHNIDVDLSDTEATIEALLGDPANDSPILRFMDAINHFTPPRGPEAFAGLAISPDEDEEGDVLETTERPPRFEEERA